MPFKVLTDLEHDGVHYESGSIIPDKKIAKKDLKRLIKLQVVETTSESVFVEKPEIENDPPKDVGDLQGAEDLMTDEEVYQEIDEGFGYPELKREAEELGLEFAGNISKKDLIQLIIDNEKDDHFLDLLENR